MMTTSALDLTVMRSQPFGCVNIKKTESKEKVMIKNIDLNLNPKKNYNTTI
jgi:hypothetical protein